MNDGSVIIDVELNTDKARKQYQSFGSEAARELDNSIGKSKAFNSLSEESVAFAKKAVLGIGAVGAAVAGFSIKSAGDMQAMNAQFSQVFGDLESNAQKSIDSISKETNILPNRLKPAFTSMAAFAKTSGMDTADALDLSSRATKAAADSAAFYDKSIGEVTESLQSYLKGNYENDTALGISSTETTRNAAANKLYGKSFNELSESQKQLTLLQMVEDGNKLSGALGQAAREGGGLENVIGNMKQAITDLGAAFGAPLLQPFLDMVSKLASGMSTLAEKFRENPALVYAVVGAVATLAAALGAAYLAANNFAKLKAIISGVKAGFLALTSPVSLVILAIGALVTAFVYFYKSSDTFREKVNGIVDKLKQFLVPIDKVMFGLKTLARGFKEILSGNPLPAELLKLRTQFTNLFPEALWQGMVDFAWKINDLKLAIKAIAGIVTGSIGSFDELEEALGGAFGKNGVKNIQAIGDAIKSVINWFKGLLSPVKSAAKSFDLVNIAFAILKSVILTMMGPIGLVIKAFELLAKALGGGDVSKGIDKILNGFDSLATGLQKNGPKIGSSASKAIEGILSAIAGALPGIISGGLKIVAAIVSGIAQGLPSLALAASQLIFAFTGAMLLLVPQIALSATAIIVAFLGALTIGLPQIIAAGAQLISSLLLGIAQQLPMLVASAATLITTWLLSLAVYMPQIVVAGMTLLINFLSGITQKLPDLVVKVGELIVAFLKALAGQMPSIVVAGANLLINFLDGLASKMPDIVAAALNLVIQFLDGIASKIGDVITAGVNLVVAIIEGIADNIDDIVDAGMDLVDSLVDGVLDAQDRLYDAAITLINGMAENIRNHSGDIKSAAGNLLSAMLEALPGSGLVSAGYNLIMGLAEGIGNAASDAVRAAKNVASDILSSVKGFFGIHSPSRVMRDQVGKFLPEGIAAGIDKGASSALDSMDSLNDDLLSIAIKDFVNKIPSAQALIRGNLTPETALGTNRVGMSSVGSQIVNNTYNTNTGSDLKQIIDAIQQRPLVVQSILDGQIIGNSVDQTNGAVLKRKFYANGSGV